MLAMITSNTRPDGTRGFQIKGLRSLWSAMKVHERKKNAESTFCSFFLVLGPLFFALSLFFV